MAITNTEEADKLIDEAARMAREIPVPPGPPSTVADTVRRMGAGTAATSPTGWRIERRIGRITRYAAAAAIVVLLTGLAGWLSRGHNHGRAGVAFADVVQRLQQVQTVTYRTVWKQDGMPDVISRDTVDMAGRYSRSEILAARDPGAESGPGAEVVRRVSIYNGGRMLTLDPVEMKANLTDHVTDGLPHRLDQSHTLADLLQLGAASAESLGEQVIDGATLLAFRVNRDRDKFNRRTVVMWVDPQSALPARVEDTSVRRVPDEAAFKRLQKKSPNGGVIKLAPEDAEAAMATWPEVTTVRIMTDIQFDVPVDESTFDVTPPPGYALTITTMPG